MSSIGGVIVAAAVVGHGVSECQHAVLMAAYILFLATVHAQVNTVVCRASTDCNGAPGDNLGIVTVEDCCLNIPNGLGYSEGEICSPCIGES